MALMSTESDILKKGPFFRARLLTRDQDTSRKWADWRK